MKLVYTLATILLAANMASAAETGISEFHQHAMNGQTQVTPHVGYETDNIKTNFTGVKGKNNGFNLGVKAEHGIAGSLAVGADVTYQNMKRKITPVGTTNDVETSGLGDLDLYAHGSTPQGAGRLAYGLDLGLSLSAQKTTTSGTTDKVDAQTGGMSLKPYVGYEMMAGPGTWGAQINYTWLGERTAKDAAGTESKTKDGNSLGLATFYEHPMSAENQVGVSLAYDMAGETKDAAGATNNDKANTLTLSVYAPMAGGNNLTVIPRLDWAKQTLDSSLNPLKSIDMINVGVAARWAM